MIDIELPQPKGTKIKICPYCEEKIYYKEEDIDYIKDYGRGIFCNLCGTFIEISKQINGNVRLSNKYIRSNRAYRSRYKDKTTNRQKVLMIAVLITIIFIIPYFWISYISPIPYGTIEQKTSTFQVFDNSTGYDISGEITISIYVPKDGVEFESKIDLYRMSNFYILINSEVAINLQVDIRPFSYIWFEINSNGSHPNYTTKFGLNSGGSNYLFCFYVCRIGNITNTYSSL